MNQSDPLPLHAHGDPAVVWEREESDPAERCAECAQAKESGGCRLELQPTAVEGTCRVPKLSRLRRRVR